MQEDVFFQVKPETVRVYRVRALVSVSDREDSREQPEL